jgi:hypothetical protein
MKIRDSNAIVIEVLVYATRVLHNIMTELGSKRKQWAHSATI